MKFQSQQFHPSDESRIAIENCAAKLIPENPNLFSWHRSYVENHKLRIALDLDIAKDQIARGSSVLEFAGFIVTNIIYRGLFENNLKQSIVRIFPSLRPFVSYVAKKPI